MKKGLESLKAAVLLNTKDGEGCFNENGCDHEFTRMVPETNPALIEMGMTQACKRVSKCFHKYCDKYKWVIERAKHYAEKTGREFEEIIEIWESNRTYWYMGYYQEGQQPLNGRGSGDVTAIDTKISLLENEIETYIFLSTTLTLKHQQSVKSDLISNIGRMKEELEACKAKKALYEISSF
jgi:hypothetical protein